MGDRSLLCIAREAFWVSSPSTTRVNGRRALSADLRPSTAAVSTNIIKKVWLNDSGSVDEFGSYSAYPVAGRLHSLRLTARLFLILRVVGVGVDDASPRLWLRLSAPIFDGVRARMDEV